MAPKPPSSIDPSALRRRLLAWYDRHRRTMPWRALPGERPEPYRVWLSEIMLQQTTVATVGPYFEAFIARWPTVEALAAADLDRVLHAWQGLGYYARARNLHTCAKVVAGEFDGRFPDSEDELRTLPGVGPYTAAAIAAIAFGRETVPVDGNVIRVLSRLRRLEEPMPRLIKAVGREAKALAKGPKPEDFAQGLMDLGATVCTPRQPLCPRCPWSKNCAARATNVVDRLPRAAPKKAKPVKYGVAFWAMRSDGTVMLRRRPASGLLGGMMEIPTTAWNEVPWHDGAALREAPLTGDWRWLAGTVRHSFTHFHLELRIVMARVAGNRKRVANTLWSAPDELDRHALPTLTKKVVRHAIQYGI